jgi:hypothetical protein
MGDHPTEEDVVKFLLLIHQGLEPEALSALCEDEMRALTAAWGEISATPGVTPGQQLAPPARAKTVRADGSGSVVTDGPFAETKEGIGGYLLFEGEDLDAALALAARIPAVGQGGAVEVRPIVEW